MQLLEGELVLSASDLTGFAACAHLTQLELSVVRGERVRPDRDDPMLDVLSSRGTEHEQKHLAREHDAGKHVVEIPGDCFTRADLIAAQEATLDAMRAGADVVYQATFFDGRPGEAHWRGHADFLYKVERPPENPSNFGNWSYEVADTKLARRVKAAAILQMAAYSEQLAALQGVTPEHIHVVTGDGESHPFRLADYAAYHRHVKARYEALVLASFTGEPQPTYPEPVDHCGICRWADDCKDRRRADDHLSLVSGLRRDQVHKLTAVGITTRVELAHAPAPLRVPGMAEPTIERLHDQARLQVEGEGVHPPIYEVLPPERPDPDDPAQHWPQRGWAALPTPSPGDLFFDMEGDPYALDDTDLDASGAGAGLEYLFGVIELDADSNPRYHSFWAHSRAEEKQAFEAFVDFVMAKRAEHPDLHIFHYAPYETSAMKRLMGAHRTREQEIDELLRAEVFVDLYAVVRQGVRIGSESYSLKKVEQLYMERPPGEVMDGGGSIVAYEAYLDDHAQHRLDEIELYNEDDCRSTLLLRNWLEARRADAEAKFGEIPRPALRNGEASEELTSKQLEARALAEQLTHDVPLLRGERTDEQQARWLLAQMLEWHRREGLPDWWMYYARLRMSDDQLLDDRECIVGLEFVESLEQVKLSEIHRYRFTPQDHKFKVGDKPHDPATETLAGEVVDVDDVHGTIDIKRGPKALAGAHPRVLIPPTPVPTGVMESAIRRLAEHVLEHGISGPGRFQAARDLLLRTPRDPNAGPFDTSYLAIQGPPGSGKTHTGADLILDLVREGKRVGITAHSHAVIGNLLHKVCERAAERGIDVRALQKAEPHQECDAAIVTCTTDNAAMEQAVVDDDFQVLAGTSWMWSRKGMENSVDVLFVDEAGQKSLADVLAVSGAAEKLVLLGDPQQLAQPSKGSHPEGAEVSALEHVLDGRATMPPEFGWFLDVTWRMHPAVCEFVSAIAYEGRLHSKDGLERQAVDGFAGLRWIPVEESGNRSWSAAEVRAVDELVRSLEGKRWTDADGASRKMTLDDILVVTPYNAQVAKLAAQLPDGARIGTVDKFQGQEAPVSIYSMATSSADDVPRSMEFLYDLQRFNVAVSRAKAMSVVVCSPKLLEAICRTPLQMKLVNALSAFEEQRKQFAKLRHMA